MQARMKNPAAVSPEAATAVEHLVRAARPGGRPGTTPGLVHPRAVEAPAVVDWS